tara:strand:- start:519 stop:1337 length:819 start_codon:yes stop_codon:yes gene_type:complete
MKHILSLGAGVQSTTMALMSANGDLPRADAAIFADTKFEPDHVYEHLERLEKKLPFPIYKCEAYTKETYGDILKHTEESIKGNIRWYYGPPAYMDKGLIRRQCTTHFKIMPIRRKIRELLGYKKGQRVKKGTHVYQWIGISTDEMNRMKESRDFFIENKWPLIEKKMSRRDCLQWCKDNGFELPKKSACIFCPYHDNGTWKEMKENQPKDFEKACEIDDKLREAKNKNYPFDAKLYLHRELKPLREVDFNKKSKQPDLFGDMADECEGMCGV